jgi:RNA polymerase sigma-70 factor (ECF subfamily)
MTTMSADGEWIRLIAGAQQGDRTAADRLVRDHDGWIRSAIYAVTGRSDLVDDVSQQVWARVWERLETLKHPARLKSWLYSIARNTAIDASISERQAQRRIGRLRLAADPGETHRSEPGRTLAGSELRQTLLRAVQSLPALYREPFVLRHLQDWSYAEIGEVLDLPVDTVETRLVRARRMLREMLQGRVTS